MRILFLTRHFGCLRNFEQAIHRLTARGHALHLVALADDILGGAAMVERWAHSDARLTWERLPSPPLSDERADLLERVHLMVDYLRYLDPAYQGASGLVDRARRRTPRGMLGLVERPLWRTAPGRRALRWTFGRLEAVTPRRQEVDRFLAAQRPDLVLFTPLIGLGSEEQDFLTAAREQGLRTLFAVWSWDNLSSKSIIRTMPDRVSVWNETQRREAVQLHHVPAERVVVTGAQAFDHWFDRQPSRDRAAFCTAVGLPDDRPLILWVCSALFKGSPVEAGFVRRWLQALRAHPDEQLREAAVLIRPHPSRLKEWAEVPLHDLGPVVLHGANPVDTAAKNDYFDSLHYSTVVAGLNTSAFLEAAIAGRGVYTVLLPEYRDNQEGTLHFPYLLTVGGGLLHATRTLAAHLDDLASGLATPARAAERSARFVQEFIRPLGLGVNASEQFVASVEQLAGAPASAPRSRRTLTAPVFRRALSWLEREGGHGRVKEWLMSPTEYDEACARRDRLAVDRAAREGRLQARRDARQQREAAGEEAKAAKLAEKAAALEHHRAEKRRARTERASAPPRSSEVTR